MKTLYKTCYILYLLINSVFVIIIVPFSSAFINLELDLSVPSLHINIKVFPETEPDTFPPFLIIDCSKSLSLKPVNTIDLPSNNFS
jgi:hypothetical protein